MKVKILKKTIKETESYVIKSLFVSFSDATLYEKIVANLKAQGCSIEQIDKFCKPNEYNGNISYAFGLNCSHFTFDRVERFGIIDANIIFKQNDKGFINAQIQIVDKKEQINGYEEPEDTVTGWSTTAPEIKAVQPMGDGSLAEPNPITEMQPLEILSLDPNAAQDLPF